MGNRKEIKDSGHLRAKFQPDKTSEVIKEKNFATGNIPLFVNINTNRKKILNKEIYEEFQLLKKKRIRMEQGLDLEAEQEDYDKICKRMMEIEEKYSV